MYDLRQILFRVSKCTEPMVCQRMGDSTYVWGESVKVVLQKVNSSWRTDLCCSKADVYYSYEKILLTCTSSGVDKNDFEGNMHVIWRRQHLNFYLTTITKTVFSFCFCTLELELVYIYYIELYLTTSIFNTVVSFCF